MKFGSTHGIGVIMYVMYTKLNINRNEPFIYRYEIPCHCAEVRDMVLNIYR